MERPIPNMAEQFRAFADKLEDPRRMENVENGTLVPSVDQKMLLALNKPYGEQEDLHLPQAGQIMEWLRQILVSVETSDQQSAVLGFFYTNIDPLNLRGITPFHDSESRVIAVGVFPRYNEIVRYSVIPHVDTNRWESKGEIRISDAPSAEVDPFLYPNPESQQGERTVRRPDLLFFRKDPFSIAHPYRRSLTDEYHYHLPPPTLVENALEENVIGRALWYANRQRNPRLAIQDGFTRFVGRNRGELEYAEIRKALRQDLRGTDPQYNY